MPFNIQLVARLLGIAVGLALMVAGVQLWQGKVTLSEGGSIGQQGLMPIQAQEKKTEEQKQADRDDPPDRVVGATTFLLGVFLFLGYGLGLNSLWKGGGRPQTPEDRALNEGFDDESQGSRSSEADAQASQPSKYAEEEDDDDVDPPVNRPGV